VDSLLARFYSAILPQYRVGHIIFARKCLRWVAEHMAVSHQDAGALGALFRQLNLGLRGIIFSLYYGGPVGFGYQGKAPLDVIGYHINRVDS
jgi:hypothetical protein